MNTAITALFEMLKQLFSLKQTDLENKSELSVVKEKDSLKKSANYAEQLILITDKYIKFFDKTDLRKYNSLKKKNLIKMTNNP